MAQVVLADEINRATPKTQSALLECMEERQATVDGTTYPMPDPFLVIATQNPIEYEGTFALPEAQLDRFMLRLAPRLPAADRGDRHPRRAEADPPARRARGGLLGRGAARAAGRGPRDLRRPDRRATTSSGSSTRRGTTRTSTSAPRRAGRSPSTGPARRWPACSAATTSSRTTSRRSPSPRLAHRLIIKTSSSIHDIQAGQVVRELLEHDARRAGSAPIGTGGTDRACPRPRSRAVEPSGA